MFLKVPADVIVKVTEYKKVRPLVLSRSTGIQPTQSCDAVSSLMTVRMEAARMMTSRGRV